jgi:predicted membrane protein (TIGR00267 family)
MINFLKNIFKDGIVRRYFIMNTFDGVLSAIGILIALLIAGVYDSNIIVMSCIGSGIAMGVSGVLGAYMVEDAERKKEFIDEKKSKKFYSNISKKSLIIGLVDGISPLVAIILMILPFFFAGASIAYWISFFISSLIIIFLGIVIAKIGKQNILSSISKLILAAFFVAAIIYFMELLKII